MSLLDSSTSLLDSSTPYESTMGKKIECLARVCMRACVHPPPPADSSMVSARTAVISAQSDFLARAMVVTM